MEIDDTLDYQVYICDQCHFLYNEDRGEPHQGIPPRTHVQDLPKDWRCPNCGADKTMLRCCQAADGFVF